MNTNMLVQRKIHLSKEQQQMKKSVEKKEYEEINKKMSKAKGFGLDKVEAWKVKTYYQTKENKEGVIFFGDINNLSQANENAIGKTKEEKEEFVNRYIKQIVMQIRFILKENEVVEYNLGKMGDEIYLYIPETIEKEKQEEIYQGFSQIQKGPLSISFGYTDDLSQGIEEAVKVAEDRMMEAKFARQQNNIRQAYQIEDIENKEELETIIGNLVQEAVKQVFDKLRITANQVIKNEKEQEIKESFKKALEVQMRKKERIKKRVEEKNQHQHKESSDPIYQQIEMLEDEIQNHPEIQLTNEEANQYILSQILIHNSIKGTNKKEYYDVLGYKKDLKLWNVVDKPKPMLLDEMKKTKMIAIDFSGIKYLNDHYTHDVTDQVISEKIEAFKGILKENNILIKNLLMNGISECYILVEGKEELIIQKAMEEIKQYKGSHNQYEKLLITNIAKEDLWHEGESKQEKLYQKKKQRGLRRKVQQENYYKNGVNETVKRLKTKLDIEKFNNKLDSDLLEEYIIQNLVMIQTHPLFKKYLEIQKEKGQTQEEVIHSLIDKGLNYVFSTNQKEAYLSQHQNQKEKGDIKERSES